MDEPEITLTQALARVKTAGAGIGSLVLLALGGVSYDGFGARSERDGMSDVMATLAKSYQEALTLEREQFKECRQMCLDFFETEIARCGGEPDGGTDSMDPSEP